MLCWIFIIVMANYTSCIHTSSNTVGNRVIYSCLQWQTFSVGHGCGIIVMTEITIVAMQSIDVGLGCEITVSWNS